MRSRFARTQTIRFRDDGLVDGFNGRITAVDGGDWR